MTSSPLLLSVFSLSSMCTRACLGVVLGSSSSEEEHAFVSPLPPSLCAVLWECTYVYHCVCTHMCVYVCAVYAPDDRTLLPVQVDGCPREVLSPPHTHCNAPRHQHGQPCCSEWKGGGLWSEGRYIYIYMVSRGGSERTHHNGREGLHKYISATPS